jgi:predicted dehydrogenase
MQFGRREIIRRASKPVSSRRSFLTAAGVAALTPTGPAAPEGKVRVAVVGGGFGAHHYWHEHPNCSVTAVADLLEERRERLRKHYGCMNAFRSMEEMFEKAGDSFDAVAIFTDAASHARHAVAVMEAGKHVVSAVPVALTLDDCLRVKAAVGKTGRAYMLHETSFYRQQCIAAREMFQEGAFGRLAYSEVEYYHPSIGGRKNTAPRWSGLKSWRYGLPPMLYPTHAVGLLVGVTGERIVKVSCFGQRIEDDDFPRPNENAYGNPFNNEMAIGITDRGNVCRIGVFWNVAAHGERGQWLGDRLSAYMSHSGGLPDCLSRDGRSYDQWNVPAYWKTDRLPPAMRHASGHGGSHTFLAHEFIQSILEKREPAININVALSMNLPGIIAHQSALRGGVQLDVPFPEEVA